MNIVLKNGRLINPKYDEDMITNVVMDKKTGTIVHIGEYIEALNDEVYLLDGMWITPGLIDLHVHLRDPGLTHKEDIETGANAAVAGGYTTICLMPNTNPVTDNAKVVSYIKEKEKALNMLDIHPVCAITNGMKGEEITDFEGLAKMGILAFSEDGKSVVSESIMAEAFRKSSELSVPIMCHCEDETLLNGGVMNKSIYSDKLGLPGISNLVEDNCTKRDTLLCGKEKGNIHICHVSTKGSTDIVRQAKIEGVNITAEVCPHHFVLTDEDVFLSEGDPNYKMNPPLRSKEDVLAILEGLRDNTLSVISSDHAPHTKEEKDIGFLKAPFGIVGLETMVPLCITHLVKTGILSPIELIRKMTINPAKVIHIDKGYISVGKKADITVINPDIGYKIDKSKFHSKSKNTPFNDKYVCGKTIMTIYDGTIVYKNI